MKWLIVVLVVIGGIWGALELRDRQSSKPQPLYPLFKPETAAKITIKSSDGGAALERAGENWLVVSEDSFPAEPSVMSDILVTIAAFSRRDKISSNPGNQALYQVDSAGTAVTVEDNKGRQVASFVVGKRGPDYQSTYVRDTKTNDVIVAQGYFSPVFDRGPRSWQDKRIFDIKPAEVVEMDVTRPGGTLVVKRGSDDKWYAAGAESLACDTEMVMSLVRSFANLRCSDFAGRKPLPEWGVENPDSSVVARTSDGSEHTLLIGHAASETSFYASRAVDGLVYIISAQNVANLLPDRAQLLPGESAAETQSEQ